VTGDLRAGTRGPDVPDLPFVDEHRITVDAPPEAVWAGLRSYVDRMLAANDGRPANRLLTRLLGTVPSAGFEVTGEVPHRRLELTGRHRFSRYALVFELEPAGELTVVRALTHARFPGLHGRVYRLLVISSRAHVVATNAMLRSIRRASLAQV
jgi:hypothetical protein